jgi:FtsP/CotA-like multicopper oxidase with cupredoxin domain
MTIRDIFLRIESVEQYSPLAPMSCSRRYGRDCMRNPGHELGRVTAQEIFATTIDALVYRQYHDPAFARPVVDKLVLSDATEPPWNRRVPGCVLYADPGDRLRIHVHNGDPKTCHSFHLHGLRYAIDSDGAWPLGVRDRKGRRSDEIRPGESWTYHFSATEATIGAWAFHDHVRDIQDAVAQGLFGGLVVRDPRAARPAHEVPLFVHQMAEGIAVEGFGSPSLAPGQSWAHTFGQTTTRYPYHCQIHGTTMAGNVTVATTGPSLATVAIVDNAFQPASVTVGPAGTVTWFNHGKSNHLVFAGGGGGSAFCLNGRSYVGNTPIVEASPGELIRWYVFNLDLSGTWHNFHPHAARWSLPGGGATDVRALSPVEACVIDTEAPDVLSVPEHPDMLSRVDLTEPRIRLRADFLVHCHIEAHMMSGLAGLLRVRREVRVTQEALERSDLELPVDNDDVCMSVDGRRSCGAMAHDAPGAEPNVPSASAGEVGPTCADDVALHETFPDLGHMHHMTDGSSAGAVTKTLATYADVGAWELLACDSRTLAVHTSLVRTGKILFVSGSGNNPLRQTGRKYGSVLWDPWSGSVTEPPVSHDVFCSGQAVCPNGDVLVVGGTKNYDSPWQGLPDASIFDVTSERWVTLPPMADGRWYPTVVALGEGRLGVFSGLNATNGALNDRVELFDPIRRSWTVARLRTPSWPLYPHLFLLADGRLLASGAALDTTSSPGPQFVNVGAGTVTAVAGLQDPKLRGQAASVLLPPAQDQRVMVISGGGGNPVRVTQACDIVDTRSSTPTYRPAATIGHGRMHLNAVLLPDRTVFVSGGGAAYESEPVLQAELYDPQTDKWRAGASATVPRLYHSVAILLPTGEVLTAGSNPRRGDDELRIELYHPPYLFRGPRPCIDDAPKATTYGDRFVLRTPHANQVRWVQLTRPMATTHSLDTEQRLVDLTFERRGVCDLHVLVPDNPNLAPPGWYLLTIVNQVRIPSVARWIQVAASHHAGS